MSAKPKVVPFERPGMADLVEALEQKVAEAKAGKIASFTFACEHVDGSNEHDAFIDANVSVYKLIGIVEMLKQRIVEMLRVKE